VNGVDIDLPTCFNVIAAYIAAVIGDANANLGIRGTSHYHKWRSIMKPRNTLEVKSKVALGALALSLCALPALAVEPDGHAFVRASILNTWAPTAVASPGTNAMDAHEQARLTIVGAPPSRSGVRAVDAAAHTTIDSQDQARQLLLAQPKSTQRSIVAIDHRRSGS